MIIGKFVMPRSRITDEFYMAWKKYPKPVGYIYWTDFGIRRTCFTFNKDVGMEELKGIKAYNFQFKVYLRNRKEDSKLV